MALSSDLDPEELGAVLPGRPIRTYPALLSTEADARAWARAGAPSGAVVVADYQASARGRGGLPWHCRPGRDLGFTLVLRPTLAPDQEGWLYVAAGLAACQVLGAGSSIEWPDTVRCEGRQVASVAAHAGLEAEGVGWAVVNLLVLDAPAPRGPLIGRLAESIERLQHPEAAVIAAYREHCTTLGSEIVAHLIPTWPDGVRISGTAASVLEDGALLIDEAAGDRRIAVRPQHLARIERRPLRA